MFKQLKDTREDLVSVVTIGPQISEIIDVTFDKKKKQAISYSNIKEDIHSVRLDLSRLNMYHSFIYSTSKMKASLVCQHLF